MKTVMILCVEDEPMLLATRAMVLQTGGFAVRGAASAGEALKLLAEEVIDAVVLDAATCELEAGIIAATIKRLRPKVPIVMLSTQPAAMPGSAVDAWITKGESPQTLLDTLRVLLPV